MTALRSITVGVVVERRKAASQWVDFIWQAIAVLPGQPDAEPWTVLTREADRTTFYAGTAEIALYRGETTNYRDNLTSSAPSVWVALRPCEGEMPYQLFAVTVDPAEGEAFTETGADLVEAVPMPSPIRDVVAAFVAEHHVERAIFKRKRDRQNTEALARRVPGSEERK